MPRPSGVILTLVMLVLLTAAGPAAAQQTRLESLRGARAERPEAQTRPTRASEAPLQGSEREPLMHLSTGLLPGGLLFAPLIADPRWPHFAAAYQYYLHDRNLRHAGAVSFGETFALYRDTLGNAWWEIGIQAGVFAVFDLEAPSSDLVNADYIGAVVLGSRYDRFSALVRLAHQSSHLGDEFLLRNRVNRLNLSYESVDLKLSYEFFGDVLRLYAGGGYLFRRDPGSLHPGSLQWGIEFRSPWPAPRVWYRPVAAIDVQHREENDWHTDISLRTGVEIASVLGDRKLQLLLEYFHGHSPNGQFYRDKVDYLGVGAHFHF